MCIRDSLLIVGGLFKKVILSNMLATRLVEPVFAVPQSYGAWDTPVSYTHLDVYKRQPPTRVRAMMGALSWEQQTCFKFQELSEIAIR